MKLAGSCVFALCQLRCSLRSLFVMWENNWEWIQAWLRDPESAAMAHWETYIDSILHQCLHSGFSRFHRQLQALLQAHLSTSSLRASQERRAFLLQLSFQAFEDVFLEEGRARVQWRHFPAEGDWRRRAEVAGLWFLLAREFLSIQQPALSPIERTCLAVERAEQWTSLEALPEDEELEVLSLMVWFRRVMDVVRQNTRTQWQPSTSMVSLEELTHESASDDSGEWTSASPRPEQALLEQERLRWLQGLFRAVCRDELDQQILEMQQDNEVERVMAEKLGLTRGQVRSRWVTLSERSRLLFQVVSPRLSNPLTVPYPRGESHLLERLQKELGRWLVQQRERTVAVDFWLLYHRLEILLSQREGAAPDQSGHWNALCQVWRRVLRRCLVNEVPVREEQLVRDLVFFWLEATQKDQRRSPLTSSVSMMPLSAELQESETP